MPVARHAKNRALREELYRSYVTVASEGDSDNEPVIEKILTLKQEKANLLGYPDHAEVSMASKVIWHPNESPQNLGPRVLASRCHLSQKVVKALMGRGFEDLALINSSA